MMHALVVEMLKVKYESVSFRRVNKVCETGKIKDGQLDDLRWNALDFQCCCYWLPDLYDVSLAASSIPLLDCTDTKTTLPPVFPLYVFGFESVNTH